MDQTNKNTLTRQEIESEIVDLNAEIMDIEQRMQEDISPEEFQFLSQRLSSSYDAMEQYNQMLNEPKEPPMVERFREYNKAKNQTEEKKPANTDYMCK